jgi:D-alanine--poly(phosphoribitol) ligase subunit 2
MNDLRQSLRTALVTRFGIDRTHLDDDTALFSSGLIDSLSVMDLVCFVESEIGCTIPPAAITLENFDSVNHIVRFAGTLASAGGLR